MDSLDSVERMLIGIKARRATAQKELAQIQEKQEVLAQEIQEIKRASEWIQAVAKHTLENVSKVVASTVTSALRVVTDEYDFEISFVSRRNKTECDLLLKHNKFGYTAHPLHDVGGGIADITSFSLRMAFYHLSKNIRNTIILDEPFKFVSLDISDEELLKGINRKLGIQIIAVTHKTKLVEMLDKDLDTIVTVTKPDSISVVHQ